MQLAVDMELKFAAGFPLVPPVDGAPASAEWNVLVKWVEAGLARSALVAPAGMTVRQLFDDKESGSGSSTYTYLLTDDVTKEAALVDPVLEQVDRDLAAVEALGLTLKYLLNTHVHADHVTGSGRIKAKVGAGCVRRGPGGGAPAALSVQLQPFPHSNRSMLTPPGSAGSGRSSQPTARRSPTYTCGRAPQPTLERPRPALVR